MIVPRNKAVCTSVLCTVYMDYSTYPSVCDNRIEGANNYEGEPYYNWAVGCLPNGETGHPPNGEIPCVAYIWVGSSGWP